MTDVWEGMAGVEKQVRLNTYSESHVPSTVGARAGGSGKGEPMKESSI